MSRPWDKRDVPVCPILIEAPEGPALGSAGAIALPQQAQAGPEVRRQGSTKIQPLSAARVDKGNAAGVKRLPVSQRRRQIGSAAGPVKGIAGNGMLDKIQMNAHLVSAAGLKPDLEQAKRAEYGYDAVTADRLSPSGDHRHAPAVTGMAAYRSLDFSLRGADPSKNQGDIFPPHGSRPQLRRKGGMTEIIFRSQQQPGRILVQAVHDSGTIRPACSGKAFAMIEQRIDQGTAVVARSRMDDHPPGLVYYQEIIIFIYNIQREPLRQGPQRPRLRKMHRNGVTRLQAVVLVGAGQAVYLNRSLGYQLLRLAAGKAGTRTGQEEIEALSRVRHAGGILQSFRQLSTSHLN